MKTTISLGREIKIFLFSFFLFLNSYSQNSNNPCTTPGASSYFYMMEDVRGPDYSNYNVYVKIYVHVLTNTQTGPGQSVLGVNESLKYLYNAYDPLGIYFVWDGNIDYIVNDDWFNIPSIYLTNIWNYNAHTDGIDIYLGSSLSLDQLGRSRGIGEGTAFIVNGYEGIAAQNDFLFWPQSNVMAHEMGHALFLWHTFHGTWTSEGDPNACAECLFETNPIGSSTYCGDYVYDTPPDPNFLPNFDNNCNYIGGGQDICNNDFNPLGNNIMSYAPESCRTNFTTGQKRRMKNALFSLPELQATKLQEYAYIRGKNIVCFSDNQFKLYSNNLSNLTIENSTNITLNTTVTLSHIEITVSNNNPTADEGSAAWIVAKRNGVEIGRKNFWVGKPQAMLPNIIEGQTSVSQNDIEDYYIPSPLEGATTYQWEFPGFPAIQQQPYVPNTSGWQYDYTTNFRNVLNSMVGACSGELFIYGINECGGELILDEGDGLNVTVSNPNPSCPDPPQPAPIIYYPNPADSLLNVDLSLQEYNIFTVKVYSDAQIVVYEDQSTNVVKTIDTFNLVNGNYYLHIYDGVELIFNSILIINH
ncbi:MAG: hypothetical protein CMC14_02230 [Flavobacteriaceae bacterium]|nr:hypothetical protein [Flavobacteriaceae bacterium]|tara:strand:+ start:126635 stop:128389 length:1755 start_codon:yes stop_codon:yes gene_type:complete